MRTKQIVKVIAGGAVAATLASAPTAFAAVDMFLKLDGITGESFDKVHKGEIDVLAWSWGTNSTETATARKQGCVAVQDFSFTKYIDKATPGLITSIAGGQAIANAKLTVRKAGEKPLEFLLVELSNVVVTSLSTGGSGGEDRLTENVTLNFASAKVTYTPQKADGSADAAIPAIIAPTCKK